MSALPNNSFQLSDGAGGFKASASATSPTPGTMVLGDGATHNGILELADTDGGSITLLCQSGTTPWVFQLPTTPGSAGQVLSTDGTGIMEWTDSSDAALAEITAAFPGVTSWTLLGELLANLNAIIASGTSGTFPISGSLGGSVSFNQGVATAWTAAT